MINVLFDADMIAFRACASVEQETDWGDGIWTLHADAHEAEVKVDDMVLMYTERALKQIDYKGKYKIVMCFSSPKNFRKGILPTYKLNRAGKRKPVCYYGVKDWIKRNYESKEVEGLEADDVIGIMATKPKTKNIIISGDKDFKTIPGFFYDFLKDIHYTITKEQADYWHLYQTLVGDTADNYHGCPGIGAVSAKKALDKDCSWETVVELFAAKKLSEHEALTQARVARILRYGEFKNHKPILWNPDRHTIEK
jgi:DNA polymerase-1